MPEKCPACASCGMPMERPEDFALGDPTQPYCHGCTDAKGRLLPYGKVLELVARHYVQSQAVTHDAAVRMAQALLADMPAWKGRAQESRG